MLTSDVMTNTTPIRRQCIEVYTSWILELLPYMNQDIEIRFLMSRTQDTISLVSSAFAFSQSAAINDLLLLAAQQSNK